MPRLRVAAFNAQDFYLLVPETLTRAELDQLNEEAYQAFNRSIYNRNKSREKLARVAFWILSRRLDLVGLCEVGGLESLRNFNRLYLGDRYEPVLHEENSRRGIYVGALLRKGIFPGWQARSLPGRFARNLLHLKLGSRFPGLQVFVVHLKSTLGQDFGLAQRMEEIRQLSSVAPARRALLMGDFNGLMIPGQAQFEFEPLLTLPYQDVLEAVGQPREHRRTHYHFGPEPAFNQLDYILCSLDLKVLRAGVIEEQIPLNRRQRDFLPSDHLMIWADLEPHQSLGLQVLMRPFRFLWGLLKNHGILVP